MPFDGDAGIIADLLPRTGQALNSALLPALGLPTSATSGSVVTVRLCWQHVDRAGDRAAQRHRHPPDPAGDRPLTQPRAMQHLDRDPFVEPQFAQSPRLGHRQPVPVDRRDGRTLPPGQ